MTILFMTTLQKQYISSPNRLKYFLIKNLIKRGRRCSCVSHFIIPVRKRGEHMTRIMRKWI